MIKAISHKVCKALRLITEDLNDRLIQLSPEYRAVLHTDEHALLRSQRKVIDFSSKSMHLTPIDHVRTRYFFRADSPSYYYLYAIKKAQATALNTHSALASHLRKYYDRVQNLTAGDWLGLPSNSYWKQYPARGALLPWEDDTPEKRIRNWDTWIEEEGAQVGHYLNINDGVPSVGPVSRTLLAAEAARLNVLLHNVQEHGYKTRSGRKNITGYVLVANDERWCFCAIHGQHRAAVAAALEYYAIPIYIDEVIHRSEASRWPQVQRGTYTLDEAFDVFDRIMAGDPPPAFDDWRAFVEQNG